VAGVRDPCVGGGAAAVAGTAVFAGLDAQTGPAGRPRRGCRGGRRSTGLARLVVAGTSGPSWLPRCGGNRGGLRALAGSLRGCSRGGLGQQNVVATQLAEIVLPSATWAAARGALQPFALIVHALLTLMIRGTRSPGRRTCRGRVVPSSSIAIGHSRASVSARSLGLEPATSRFDWAASVWIRRSRSPDVPSSPAGRLQAVGAAPTRSTPGLGTRAASPGAGAWAISACSPRAGAAWWRPRPGRSVVEVEVGAERHRRDRATDPEPARTTAACQAQLHSAPVPARNVQPFRLS